MTSIAKSKLEFIGIRAIGKVHNDVRDREIYMDKFTSNMESYATGDYNDRFIKV